MGLLVKPKFSSNIQDYVRWLTEVPEETQASIEFRIPDIRRATRGTVRQQLKVGHGVDEGIYRKSFRINNFAEHKYHVGFQVYAKKPHYRLTHLLEDGHEVWAFRKGQGRPTKFGNVGMVDQGFKSKVIKHIEPGQEYADERVINLYEETIRTTLKKGMVEK